MTLSNDELARRFVAGDATGKACNMEIAKLGEYRAVIGYSWAVYACELPDDHPADVALFGDGYATDSTAVGWAGYSGTTTGHLQILKAALEDAGVPFAVVDSRVKRGWSGTGADKRFRDIDALGEYVDGDTVEKQGYTGYLYRKP